MRYLIIILLFNSHFCHANIGEQILKEYQSKLYSIPVTHQEHFAFRMYALTGKEEYINPIINYLYLLGDRYRYLYNLENNLVIEVENKRLLSVTDSDTEKTKRRIEKFDLTKGEHRNILTIMLFIWPDKLTPVPTTMFQKMLEKNFVLNDYESRITYGLRVPY